MADIQWQMMTNCLRNVKPGGILTYSTSSITVEENEMVIERLLNQHPELSLLEIPSSTGLPGLRGLAKCQRLYPNVHHSNGLFCAKLLKNQD